MPHTPHFLFIHKNNVGSIICYIINNIYRIYLFYKGKLFRV